MDTISTSEEHVQVTSNHVSVFKGAFIMSEASVPKKKRNTAYYINSVIVFILMIGIGQLPPFAQITELGMQVLGIFVGVLYGWCTVSLVWPGLVGIVAIGITEYCTVTEAFQQSFGSDIPLMVIVVYVLAAYLEECGLNQYVANWFISRKIGEGRPWVFTSLILSAAFVMSAFVSSFATVVILWMIFYKICEQVGEKPRSKYAEMVIAAIVIISFLTGAIFPFKAMSVIQIGLTQQAIGQTLDINFFIWTLYNVVFCIVMMAIFLIVYKFLMKPDLSKIKKAGELSAQFRGQKMNKEQKIGAAVLAIFILGLALPSVLPEGVPGMTMLEEMSILGVGTACLIGLAFVKTKEGKPFVDLTQLISKGVNWQLIILLASTMPLCNALEAEECGVLQSVIAWMTTTFSGLTGFTYLIAIAALFLVVTQFTHNLVLILVFTPVLTKMGLNFGLDPVLVMLVIYYTAMTAYATPAASSNAALIFGNEKWVSTADAYKTGIMIVICAFVAILGFAIPLGYAIF